MQPTSQFLLRRSLVGCFVAVVKRRTAGLQVASYNQVGIIDPVPACIASRGIAEKVINPDARFESATTVCPLLAAR